MVAAVLALGDVDFVERPDAKDGEPLTALSEPSRPRLEAAARLLDVSPERILNALTSRKINAGISNQVEQCWRCGGMVRYMRLCVLSRCCQGSWFRTFVVGVVVVVIVAF